MHELWVSAELPSCLGASANFVRQALAPDEGQEHVQLHEGRKDSDADTDKSGDGDHPEDDRQCSAAPEHFLVHVHPLVVSLTLQLQRHHAELRRARGASPSLAREPATRGKRKGSLCPPLRSFARLFAVAAELLSEIAAGARTVLCDGRRARALLRHCLLLCGAAVHLVGAGSARTHTQTYPTYHRCCGPQHVRAGTGASGGLNLPLRVGGLRQQSRPQQRQELQHIPAETGTAARITGLHAGHR
mmetsp:Transcript_92142/g.265199  ORF Transcript_92142/g.265199 Transcript_92142/m.265199 type:complete len:245 (-) Transcript_92142:249-983(-)